MNRRQSRKVLQQFCSRIVEEYIKEALHQDDEALMLSEEELTADFTAYIDVVSKDYAFSTK